MESEWVAKSVAQGAQFIAIITNDGWWGNTPGYRQHESYACMRAIENRRWVIRSANTGVSAIIDPEGHILESRPWLVTAAVRFSVPAETEQTFYTRYGDIISKISLALTFLLWMWHAITIIKTRKGRG